MGGGAGGFKTPTLVDGDVHSNRSGLSWKDYRDRLKTGLPKLKEMSLSYFEFMRRFLLHILPEGFHKIRYYGILSNGQREEKLKLCRSLLGMIKKEVIESIEGIKDWLERFDRFINRACP